MIRFAQIGNFVPAHSTENELRKAIELAGYDVEVFQEDEPGVFADVAACISDFDVVLWTKTDRQPPLDFDAMRHMLAAAEALHVPVVAYHLDLWWGLRREHQVHEHPFFRSTIVITADGGHDDDWARVGVNHRWMPPGVSEVECSGGQPRLEYTSDLAFVGSWRPGYHREHPHRAHLVDWLRTHYRDRVAFWPRPGEHAVRGVALRDLYASTKVNVGDSCLAGRLPRYWSDRIPETIGRGGFLIHPHVDGIDDHYVDGEHLALWQVGDWAHLAELIDRYLDDEDERRRIAAAGRAHVLEHHTYTVRIRQVVDLLEHEGLLRREVASA